MAQEARYYAGAGADFPGSGGGFEHHPGQELFSLQSGMEMLGMSSKHQGLFAVPAEITSVSAPWQQQQQHHQHHQHHQQVDDASLRCLFPSESRDRSLSLSLYNPNPPGQDSGLHQVFQIPKPLNLSHQHLLQQQQQQQQQHQQQQQMFLLSNSKYLAAAQELLNEFCSLGGATSSTPKHKKNSSQWEEGAPSSSSSSSLFSLDLLELQNRKTKLISMLEEVDSKYRRYCEQMRTVVSSFEAVAGDGAATVYSTLASKAMSRHFRCLRDGIVGQIKATRSAMGEKDPVAPGTTRGETPRLKLIDQCLRQQKAFQQAGIVESHPWRPQRGLPERSVSVLRAWLFEHFLHPYPSDVDKHILARQTGLSRSQVSNWFINARVRLWKPMVEEMYMEEVKEDEHMPSNPSIVNEDDTSASRQQNQLLLPSTTNPNSSLLIHADDRKPAPAQLLTDSGSLSSVVHRPRATENFGMADMDFGSYTEHCGGQNFGGSGVSLTLGLQQHTGGGMGLSFSPAAAQSSLFFSRENMEDCPPLQFTTLDGEAQNLPYRNLMGAQLLHDLAG